MVILYLGHVPLARHHHLALFRAYARRMPVVYLELADRGATQEAGPRANVADVVLEPFGPGLTLRRQKPRLPGGRWGVVSRWNWWLATRAALRDLKKSGHRDRVLMIQTPNLLPTLSGLDADLTAYLIVDDYVGLVDASERAAMARAHRRLTRAVDLVWAVSPPLVEEARAHRAEVHPTTHGVDYDAFEQAAGSPLWPPLAALPSPRVGALGKLNDRVDWSLVEAIAVARPDWSLVFVGPLYLAGETTHRAVERLRSRPNVHFLPEVPATDVPIVITGLDVGLILYRQGPGTSGIHPLKLYQYFAAGRPVVALPLPVIEAFRDVVRMASTPEGFVAAIAAELGAPDARERAERRRALARGLDWDRVAGDRLALLGRSLASRNEDARG